jgi:hypothetical protein
MVKPEFFRHEELQDLEVANPGKYPMFVFEGLWTKCDKNGVFEWKPRTLKLDILPFLPFEMSETLSILENAGHIKHYEVDGKEYGYIATFTKHQSLSKAELANKNVYPLPPDEKQIKPSSNGLETVSESSSNGLETTKNTDYGLRITELQNTELPSSNF